MTFAPTVPSSFGDVLGAVNPLAGPGMAGPVGTNQLNAGIGGVGQILSGLLPAQPPQVGSALVVGPVAQQQLASQVAQAQIQAQVTQAQLIQAQIAQATLVAMLARLAHVIQLAQSGQITANQLAAAQPGTIPGIGQVATGQSLAQQITANQIAAAQAAANQAATLAQNPIGYGTPATMPGILTGAGQLNPYGATGGPYSGADLAAAAGLTATAMPFGTVPPTPAAQATRLTG
jgi:hypothetical protein